jgi:hypothetical protein
MRISPDNAKIIIEEISGLRNNLEKIFQEMSNKLDAIEKKIKLDLPPNTHNPVQYRSPVKPINQRKNSF